jgi:hypothetical protein
MESEGKVAGGRVTCSWWGGGGRIVGVQYDFLCEPGFFKKMPGSHNQNRRAHNPLFRISYRTTQKLGFRSPL